MCGSNRKSDESLSYRRSSPKLLHYYDDTISAVAEESTGALRVAGSIPVRNKYLYDLEIVVPGLDVCVCGVYVCKRTHDTGFIARQ